MSLLRPSTLLALVRQHTQMQLCEFASKNYWISISICFDNSRTRLGLTTCWCRYPAIRPPTRPSSWGPRTRSPAGPCNRDGDAAAGGLWSGAGGGAPARKSQIPPSISRTGGCCYPLGRGFGGEMHAGLSSRKFVGIRRFAPLKRRGPMHRPRESLVVLLHGAPPPPQGHGRPRVCANGSAQQISVAAMERQRVSGEVS